MQSLNVIAKTTEPTEWVNSLVIARKKNGKIRVCMDPSSLNKAIYREHYPMRTIEEVISQMPNAKIFSVLDANHGFWQVKLDSDSSKLCTFNTPFGRYSFKRLPFGITSAPEVFQKITTELFEGITGVEVIVDDILVWGEDLKQHDERLEKVLQRAKERNLKLNRDKCKFRSTQVPYIGHLLTDEGLKADPGKVQAILDMPTPNSTEELLRFLGIITYLQKFVPNMSQLAAPLRQLLEKNVLWHWVSVHDDAFRQLKTAITQAPVLHYFDVSKPVTLSVDASSKGMGALILQEGPVAYASKTFTECQQRYSRMEKEISAIVFGCEKFKDYLCGQEKHMVETDHKPLESILQKPIASAPPHLQKMIMKIQCYPLVVEYKPGRQLSIADALFTYSY